MGSVQVSSNLRREYVDFERMRGMPEDYFGDSTEKVLSILCSEENFGERISEISRITGMPEHEVVRCLSRMIADGKLEPYGSTQFKVPEKDS